jgi:release factor glutamine methyltransferase
MERWTIGSLLDTAAGYLRDKGSDSPRLDAELLLAETLGLDRVHLYTEFDRPLTAGEVDRYRASIARRAAREPVAYILGRAYFRHLCLEVTPAVLVPRPETEELVEVALGSLLRRPVLRGGPGWPARASAAGLPAGAAPPAASPPPADGDPVPLPYVADVGTGSGAIALSLAQEAGESVLAADTSLEALAVAARNAAAVGLAHLVRFEQADLLEGVVEGSLHLVVSNPPYVRSGDMAALAPGIRLFEPSAALDAGPDGLAVIRRLVPQAARALHPGGSVILEVGDGQAQAVAGLARDAGFSLVTVHMDLSQKERIVEATLPGALSATTDGLGEEGMQAVKEALGAGAMIGVPTDTVYGIAARWDSPAGVRRLFTAKGRAPEQPVQVLFPSVAAVEEALPDLDQVSLRVLRALLPGPFTFIVATAVPRPPHVGTPDSLGVRVPGHPPLLGLLSLATPLAATSANASGGSSVAALAEVDPVVLAHCSVAFTEGTAEVRESARTGAASTVVDLRPLSSGGAAVVAREGAVAAKEVVERIAGVL